MFLILIKSLFDVSDESGNRINGCISSTTPSSSGLQSNNNLTNSPTPPLPPTIKTICPSESWCQGGTIAIIIGDHFHDSLQVNFGSITVWAEVC